jgi:DNA-directed RNA polymerase specialized sigma24 family protein
MPLTDVAGALGVPIGTVKSRLHRALGEMRAGVETDATTPSPVPGGQVA